MKSRGMSASDLARQVWGSTTDRRGFSVARNRDRISHYLAGTSYPEPQNLEMLARVLEVPVETLALPQPTSGRYQFKIDSITVGPKYPRPTPQTINMATVQGQPGMVRLQVDQVIPWQLAGEIYTRLLEADAREIYPRMRRYAEIAEDEDKQPEPGDVIDGGKRTTEAS